MPHVTLTWRDELAGGLDGRTTFTTDTIERHKRAVVGAIERVHVPMTAAPSDSLGTLSGVQEATI